MSINPDEKRDAEMTDDQLENVAGGNKIPAPRISGKSLPASELSEEDLEGVAGGKDSVDPTGTVMPPKKRNDFNATEVP